MLNGSQVHRLKELFAVLPILSICVAGYYKYSFYKELNLLWVLSEISLSQMLFNSIPLFLDALFGFIAALALYLGYIRSKSKLFIFSALIAFFLPFTISSFISSSLSILDSLKQIGLFLYIAILSLIFFWYKEPTLTANVKNLISLFLIFLLMLFQPLIQLKSEREIEKLLGGNSSYSRVYFKQNSKDGISNFVEIVGKDKQNPIKLKLDWRIVEIVGDKVIVICITKAVFDEDMRTRGNLTKRMVKIVEYKDIEKIF